MRRCNVRYSADPGVGRPSGCADDQTQNIQFGMARADRPGDQVAEHIGGYSASSLPPPVTLRDDTPNGGLLQIGGTTITSASS